MPGKAYMGRWTGPWMVYIKSCRPLSHWGRVTHICVGNLTIIGSDNGLSPGRRQAIISTSADILFIGPLGTNFSEIFIEIKTFSFKKSVWKCRLRNGGHFASASMCYAPSHYQNQWWLIVRWTLRKKSFLSKIWNWRKCNWKCRLQNVCYFVWDSELYNKKMFVVCI